MALDEIDPGERNTGHLGDTVFRDYIFPYMEIDMGAEKTRIRKENTERAYAIHKEVQEEALRCGITLIVPENKIHWQFNHFVGYRILNYYPATGTMRLEGYGKQAMEKVAETPWDALEMAKTLLQE